MTTINVFDGHGEPAPWTFNEVEQTSIARFTAFIERAAMVWEEAELRQLWARLAVAVKYCTKDQPTPGDLMSLRAMLEAVTDLVATENAQFHGDCAALVTAVYMRLRYLGIDDEQWLAHLSGLYTKLLPATCHPTGTIIIACYEITRTHLGTRHEQITLDSVRRDHYSEMGSRNINDMPWALHSVILYQGKTENLFCFEDVIIQRVDFLEKEESLRLVMKYRDGKVQDHLLNRDGGGKLPEAKKKPVVTIPSPDNGGWETVEPLTHPQYPPWQIDPQQAAQWPQHEPDEATKEAIRRLVETRPTWLDSKPRPSAAAVKPKGVNDAMLDALINKRP